MREDNVINWYEKKKALKNEKREEKKEEKKEFSEWDNLMKEIDEMRKMVDSNEWDYVVL